MVVMNTVFKTESVSADAKVINNSPSVDLNIYSGKYKMAGLPFEFIVISVKDKK